MFGPSDLQLIAICGPCGSGLGIPLEILFRVVSLWPPSSYVFFSLHVLRGTVFCLCSCSYFKLTKRVWEEFGWNRFPALEL